MGIALSSDNQDGWRAYSSAPPLGTRVCALSDLAEKTILSLEIESEKGKFPLLAVMDGERPRAFVNACPHQYLPLDFHGDNILSADGRKLMCTSHGAGFSVDDGRCIEGPADGCALDAVPVNVDGEGFVTIG